MNTLQIHKSSLAGLLLTFGGFSFWFFLGFPFANHNESYLLVSQLRHWSLWDVLTKQLYPVANPRPLGQAVAWILYKISGGSIAPVQIFNYVGALAAWGILFVAARQRLAFGLAALLNGGFLFTGYVYLFHLHGVFYSPLLMLTAGMIAATEHHATLKTFVIITLWSLVATLFHVYALLLYGTYILGILLDRKNAEIQGRQWMYVGGGAVICAVLTILLMVLPRVGTVLTPETMVAGLAVSYQMVELNKEISVIVLILSCATLWSMDFRVRTRILATIALIAVAFGMQRVGIPILYLWIALCLAKSLMMRKYTLALFILLTSMFPAPAATGSPTYLIFLMLICSYVTVVGWSDLEERLGRIPIPVLLSVPAFVTLIVILLRAGVSIPLVSRAAEPLLAEREKTFQLERIVEWYLQSPYADYEIELVRDSYNPTDEKVEKRLHRPPADREELDLYLRTIREPAAIPSGKLFLSFGDDPDAALGEVVYVTTGRFAGSACLVKPTTSSAQNPQHERSGPP